MARCIFRIDLDAFFVSVKQMLNPKLKGKPVIVSGDPERRGVVASAHPPVKSVNQRKVKPSDENPLCQGQALRHCTPVTTTNEKGRYELASYKEGRAAYGPAFTIYQSAVTI